MGTTTSQSKLLLNEICVSVVICEIWRNWTIRYATLLILQQLFYRQSQRPYLVINFCFCGSTENRAQSYCSSDNRAHQLHHRPFCWKCGNRTRPRHINSMLPQPIGVLSMWVFGAGNKNRTRIKGFGSLYLTVRRYPHLVSAEGFQPPFNTLEAYCIMQLCYTELCTEEEIRAPDLSRMRGTLWPPELLR